MDDNFIRTALSVQQMHKLVSDMRDAGYSVSHLASGYESYEMTTRGAMLIMQATRYSLTYHVKLHVSWFATGAALSELVH